MTWLALVVGAAVVNLVVADIAGWLPWIAERIIKRAARVLPMQSRDRYEQEWLAELDVLPGGDISQIVFSIRLRLRARRVGREIMGTQRERESPLPSFSQVRPVADFLLIWGGLLAAVGPSHVLRNAAAPDGWLIVLPPLVLALLMQRGTYRSRLSSLAFDGIATAISSVSVAVMVVVAARVVISSNASVAPHEWVRIWVFSLLALSVGRASLVVAHRWARARRLIGKPVLIMGAGVVGAQIARRLEAHPEYGLSPIGFLDDEPRAEAEVGGRRLPVLGTTEDLDKAVARTGTRNLIVAFSSAADERVSRLIQRSQELGIEVFVVPRMFDTINNRVGYDTVGGLPLMSFTRVDPRGIRFMIKHGFDRMMALALLGVLSLLLLAAAIAVRVSSSGPVLSRQRRVGRDGKAFDVFKFRSMRMQNGHIDPDDEDPSPLEHLLGGDAAPGGVEGTDRHTAVGRFLRRTSFDELPQLFNVLKGEMSVIGPRPERPEFVELFNRDIVRYDDRHRVKSGITGWAQVHGLRGQTSLAERIEWDNYYIANWSLGLDLKILALTVVALLRSAE